MHALSTLRRLNAAAAVRSEPAALYAVPDHHPHDDDVIAEALHILERRHARGGVLGSPRDVIDYFRVAYAGAEREIFSVLFVDTRHRAIALEELFAGTIDGASVHPRVVVQRALALNAGAVVLVHNHPSGHPEPSQADQAITQRLRDALALVDVRVLDHIVVGAEGAVSFAERGLI